MGLFLTARLRKAATTSEIEARRAQLEQDYKEFMDFSESKELKDFLELEQLVNSESFKQKKKKIESKKYKGSTSWKKERTFLQLSNSKKFRIYFEIKDSSELKAFILMRDSDELVRFKELQTKIKSPSFKKKQHLEEWNEFQSMLRSQRIKEFFKFKKSKRYRIFREVEGSSALVRYRELEEYLNTPDFQQEKEFLLNKRRFETTDEYRNLQEYEKFKSSQTYQKYLKLKKQNPFVELKKWELTFNEDFDGSELDRGKWITRYYWGDVFLKDSYALPHEKHYFTDGNNISVKESVARLETRREQVQGKVWDPSLGFNFKDFEYTAGMISTGKSFRQLYGKFEAKIRVTNPQAVNHSFWMLSDQMLPHIDILKTTHRNQFSIGNLWGSSQKPQHSISKIKGFDFSRDFFIYGLEWTAEKLIWTINDVVVKEQKIGVPQEAMYVIFSSGITSSEVDGSLPAVMEIDWVRCYQKKD